MKYDIFVSYSRKDSGIVLPIVERLKAEGYRCWMDVSGIESGDAFKQVIVDAIKTAGVILFFSSANANKSGYTVKEINVAVELCKVIIPVKLDDAPYADSIMFDLSGLDFVVYSDGEDIARLQKTLKARLRQKASDGALLGSFSSISRLPMESACDIRQKSMPYDRSVLLGVIDKASKVNDVHCEESTCAYGHAAGVDIHDIDEMRRLLELDESIRREHIIANRYEVAQLLKYGGRSVVYKVRDKQNNESLALKIATLDMAPKLSYKSPWLFLRRLVGLAHGSGVKEDQLATISDVYKKIMEINHPNLARIREFVPNRGCGRYYVSEDLIDGASLGDVMRSLESKVRGMSRSANAVKDVMMCGCCLLSGIAAGLDFLHENGIVHCDIKPDNIMVGKDGVPLITDFGEARILSKCEVFQVGKLDVLGITPTYMAPEQWARTSLDPRTDQYALGVIAYQFVFHRLPFDSKNFMELRDAVMFEKIPLPSICPKSICDCLARALAKKRKDRFRSCKEFISTFEQAVCT